MEFSELTIRLLLLFFPGIVCAFLVDTLTVHRPREPFFFILRAFLFGLGSYFAYWGCLKLFSLACGRPTAGVIFLHALTQKDAHISFREIVYATALAVILASVLTACSKFKLLHNTARRLKLTNKFGELDVWGFFFNAREIEWVTVRDHKNDLIYEGFVNAFSDDSRHAEVMLQHVSVYKNSTGEALYHVGAVYLSMKRDDICIEVRNLPIDERVQRKENAND